jgi:hypothetical protein
VQISTPITSDSAGDIYFGFIVTGNTGAGLQSGLARISASGQGSWVAAITMANDAHVVSIQYNSAPALSNDERTLYVAVNQGDASGYLLALDSTTLAQRARRRLFDPKSGQVAALLNISTASPVVGPDGDVYIGVFENPFPENNDRGWLLHFSAALSQTKTPGAFGWDDTPSIVPASMVPSYHESSAYLLMAKYNNYGGIGTGDGQNKVAILDPNSETEIDPVTGVTVMNPVLSILGPTADSEHPGGVREWCINAAAVDPATRCVLVNSEDGTLYRWNLATNTFTQQMHPWPPQPARPTHPPSLAATARFTPSITRRYGPFPATLHHLSPARLTLPMSTIFSWAESLTRVQLFGPTISTMARRRPAWCWELKAAQNT